MASGTIQSYADRAAAAEKHIQDLQRQIKAFESHLPSGGTGGDSAEVVALKNENAKLQYQLTHLQRSIDAEKAKIKSGSAGPGDKEHMMNIHAYLCDIFRQAISAAYPDLSETARSAQITPAKKHGDYQCNNAMSLTQTLKAEGKPTKPRDVAAAIVEKLPKNDLVEKVEVAGPGFINISLYKSFLSQLVTDVLVHGVRPPIVGRRHRVIIDYSSPNIAKEMHVGHLRSTVIGDCIARILEFCRHDVLRLNHIGDWGTQFGMLITHLQDTYPDYEKVSPPIGDLQDFYRASKKRFEEDEDFKKRAYQHVVQLQSRKNASITKAWERICDISRQEFLTVYKRLSIGNLVERGESFYQPVMEELVGDMDRKGLLTEEEGRKVFYLKKQSVPMTIVKSDGGFTYDTSDMAAIWHRTQKEKASWIIYVVDNGQSLHFQQLFEGAQVAGFYNDRHSRVEHVGFGVVLGEDRKKFKSRSGDTVRLRDLLDEGVERAEAKLKEKGRDKVLSAQELEVARDAVAYGCIKYADLAHQRTNDYIFSFDKMLDDKGNTAVYLLYAYTRIRSIARVAGVDEAALAERAASTPVVLDEPSEYQLARHLLRFPEIIQKIHEDLCPHSLCEFLYDLCTHFTEFYDRCYCVEKDRVTGEIKSINYSRLLLCEAAARIMLQGFSLLGIVPCSRM